MARELVITSGDEGTDGAIRRVREIVAAEPKGIFTRINTAIQRIGRRTIALPQTKSGSRLAGLITHFVAALGTSGTFVGVSRRLKEFNRAVKCISLQPDAAFHGLEGWKHMQTAIRPAIYDETLADENLEVGTEEAYRMVKRMAREEGLLVSPSAAAAMLGCFQVAKGVSSRTSMP